MKIRAGLSLPYWSEWRKWRIIKELGVGETCTNTIIGYKHKVYKVISIYLCPLFVKFYF